MANSTEIPFRIDEEFKDTDSSKPRMSFFKMVRVKGGTCSGCKAFSTIKIMRECNALHVYARCITTPPPQVPLFLLFMTEVKTGCMGFLLHKHFDSSGIILCETPPARAPSPTLWSSFTLSSPSFLQLFPLSPLRLRLL